MRSDLVIIGAGPAGLAAAIAARKSGIKSICIIERDVEAGGILNQCIHSGFGLSYFNQELTGPEYATRFIDAAKDEGIEVMFDTMALAVTATSVKALNTKNGLFIIDCKAVILAMGCRERTRFAIAIPGTRPSGVMPAGLAQRYINIEGKVIGKRVVILGSGDIGLIMARRMTLEGAKVEACVEIMPYSSGLTRNIAQCLDDFDIPLLLSHTVTRIHGVNRVSGVTICRVDEYRNPIVGEEEFIECDTLLLSVGLIPENELSTEAGIILDERTRGPIVNDFNETSIKGIFACGNVLQVHDLVDFVSLEAERTGIAAASYILNKDTNTAKEIVTIAGNNVSYLLPQRVILSNKGYFDLYFRVIRPIAKGDIVVTCNKDEILRVHKEHLTPGEMQLLNLDKKYITGDIAVDVEEKV